MDIPLYSMAGQLVGHIPVDEAALGGKPSWELLRQAVIAYEANQRVGTAKAKRKSEVAGSGRKPWPQKHTGRARHGFRRSPLWVGGAVVHGPRPREYRQKLNKKARQRALCAAFLAKAADGEVLAVENLELPEMKTRHMAAVLRNLGINRTFLLVLPEHNGDLWRCTRNIRGASMCACRELNAYEMIRPQRVVFTREAIEQFLRENAVFAPQPAASPESQ